MSDKTLLQRWSEGNVWWSNKNDRDELIRAMAIAQAVDEWRPSPPHDGDLCQRAEADAKLRMMRRADELLKADATSP